MERKLEENEEKVLELKANFTEQLSFGVNYVFAFLRFHACRSDFLKQNKNFYTNTFESYSLFLSGRKFNFMLHFITILFKYSAEYNARRHTSTRVQDFCSHGSGYLDYRLLGWNAIYFGITYQTTQQQCCHLL